MELKRLFKEENLFHSEAEIKEFIRFSKNYDRIIESPAKANALLIFRTSKQQTWLVCTSKSLYCILDDNRKTSPHINWSMRRDQIIQDDNIVLNTIIRKKTETTGLIDFGERHSDWLYSKALFRKETILTKTEELIIDSLIKGEFGDR